MRLRVFLVAVVNSVKFLFFSHDGLVRVGLSVDVVELILLTAVEDEFEE